MDILKFCKRLFPNNGFFDFDGSQSLGEINNAPDIQRGVYIFFSMYKGKETLCYIGKSGTIEQDGTWQGQCLKGRIENTRGGMRTEHYFRGLLNEPEIDSIRGYWFVTITDDRKYLPAYVEGKLLQMYYKENKHLPELNKKF